MKLKLKDRLLLLLCALFVLAVGIGLVLLSFRQPSMLADSVSGSFFSWARLGMIAIGVVLVLCAIYFFLLPSKLRDNRKGFVVQQTDNGELRIAIKAIENLVKKCVDMHEEMRLSAMTIQTARDGVTIDLRISLANNISIPLAVASLQKQIRQYLAVSSGIEVRRQGEKGQEAPASADFWSRGDRRQHAGGARQRSRNARAFQGCGNSGGKAGKGRGSYFRGAVQRVPRRACRAGGRGAGNCRGNERDAARRRERGC